MELAFSEIPLAIFTTLAPIAAGGFIALAIALFTVKFTDEQYKKLDKLSWIPFALLVVGFIAAFFHLTQPFNAINVFTGLGRSPMSNEIVVGVAFGIVSLIYCIMASLGKLSEGARKGFGAVVAVVGLVFALFVGMAYMIDTIESWNTFLVPVGVLGFCLFGGGLFGILALALTGSLGEARKTSFKTIMLTVLIVGIVLSAIGVIGQMSLAGGIVTPAANGAAMVSGTTLYVVLSMVGFVAAFVCGYLSLSKNDSSTIAMVGFIVAIVAVFLARLVFYALQISIGL